MPISLTGLVYRLVKGSPLSAQEGDGNLTLIQNFVNGLGKIIGISLNPDGTLKAGALNNPNQVSNVPAFSDTFAAGETMPVGNFAANVYTVINPVITAYVAGMRVRFVAGAANAGVTTVQFNALPAVPIMKGVNVALSANDILANQAVELVYDGTNFQLAAMLNNVASGAEIITGTDNNKCITAAGLRAARFTSTLFALGTGTLANSAHGLGAVPFGLRWVLACQDVGGDAGYAQNDEVPATCFTARFSAGNVETIGIAYVGGANATNVFLSGSTLGAVGVAHKTTGDYTAITTAKWKAKCYAKP